MSREKPRQVDNQLGRAKESGSSPEAEEPPARAAAYLPPMAVPKESRYHTIDMKAVRLSPDIDPQRMKTQLSLRAVRAVAEKRPPTRLPAWIALLLVGGALGTCVWWFSRWRDVQGQPAPAAAGLPVVTVAASVLVPIAEPAVQSLDPSPGVVASIGEGVPNASSAPPAIVPVAASSPAPTEVLLPAVTPPKPVRVTSPQSQHQVKRAVNPLNSESRKLSTPPVQASEVAPAATSQPRLWLE